LVSKLESENQNYEMDENNKIVYDCFENSPFYENLKEPYFDENFAVDLGPIEE
jgi:hypothetical protein